MPGITPMEVLGSTLFMILALTVFTVWATFPAWLVGLLKARSQRPVAVPLLYRHGFVRWALWYLPGIVAVFGIAVAFSPSASKFKIVGVGVGILAWMAALLAAFYIGWLQGRKHFESRRVRRGALNPVNPGPSGFHGAELRSDKRRGDPPSDDEYGPAQPWQ